MTRLLPLVLFAAVLPAVRADTWGVPEPAAPNAARLGDRRSRSGLGGR